MNFSLLQVINGGENVTSVKNNLKPRLKGGDLTTGERKLQYGLIFDNILVVLLVLTIDVVSICSQNVGQWPELLFKHFVSKDNKGGSLDTIL